MGEGNQSRRDAFFIELYQKQYKKMLLYASAILSGPSQADEAVQDAFAEAWIHIDKLLDYEKPEWWLQKAVKHKAFHILQERANDMRRLVALDNSTEQKLPAAPDLFEAVEAESREKTSQKIVRALTSEEYALLRRIALDRASYRTAAEENGLSIGACYKKIQRIRQKLKKFFPNR
ncbi:MAG: sigma-70 family RNA polymerase sigma factor [Oscillospiraceae bacterium]|nr:sigma-70 family RNA polymerase sigma factor [Oscillospiraceae bacterium]